MKQFKGTVKVKVKNGMIVSIKSGFDRKRFFRKKFIVSGAPFEMFKTEVVSLKNSDGSVFRNGYPLSMLEVIDTVRCN